MMLIHTPTSFNRSTLLFRSILTSMLLLLLSTSASEAQNQKLCFTQVTGLPNKISDSPPTWNFPNNPPNLTTDPAIDTGWFDAYRLSFDNGTPSSDGTMQAIAQGKMMYLSFKVENDQNLSIYDTLVLGFDNRGNQQFPRQYTWIVIQPFSATQGTTTGILPQPVAPNSISVWTASTATGNHPNWTPVSSYPWIKAAFFASAGPPFQWWVTIAIDTSDPTGPHLASTGLFGTLLDAVATSSGTPAMDRQFPFPSTLTGLMHSTTIDPTNPDTTLWADATFEQNCSGVHFSVSDITNTVTTGGGSPHLSSFISTSPTQANTFSVNVHNSNPAAAASVGATFRIANFGLPADNSAANEWQVLGQNVSGGASDSVANNPTTRQNVPGHNVTGLGSCTDAAGGHDASHDGCSTFSAGAWTLGHDNSTYYSLPNHTHQCVRVDLSSPSGATFINSSAWNNFDFQATASKFVSPPATISARYPVVAAHPANQIFDLVVSQEKVAPVSSKIADVGNALVSTLNLVVHGCRHTGTFITIDPPKGGRGDNETAKKFENCEIVGGYGYGVAHTDSKAVDNWGFDLAGQGLEKVQDGVYRLNAPQGGVSLVTTTVEPNPAQGGSVGGNGSSMSGGAIPWWFWLLLILILLIVLILFLRRIGRKA